MEIASIPNTFLGLVGRSSTPDASPAPTPAGTAPPLLGGAGAQARQILSGYDMQNITPSAFSDLIQQLQDGGIITEADQRELAQIRAELDESGTEPDEPVNLIEFLNARLAENKKKLDQLLRRNSTAVDPDAYLNPTQRQLAWVQKFAALQKTSGNAPVDAVI
jgi:hypothetical protein